MLRAESNAARLGISALALASIFLGVAWSYRWRQEFLFFPGLAALGGLCLLTYKQADSGWLRAGALAGGYISRRRMRLGLCSWKK
jgi:hypothetical protein